MGENWWNRETRTKLIRVFWADHEIIKFWSCFQQLRKKQMFYQITFTEIWNGCNLLSQISIRLDKLPVAHYLRSNKTLLSAQATPITFPGDHLHNSAFPVSIQPINHTTQFQSTTFQKHFFRRCVLKSILQTPAEITLAQLICERAHLQLMCSHTSGFTNDTEHMPGCQGTSAYV